MNKQFKFVCATKILIFFEDKFLILQRSQTAPSFPLYWDLPGGLIDQNENPRLTITREVLEEINISIINIKVLEVTNFIRIDQPVICIIFESKLNGKPIINLSNEHSDYKWIKLSELHNINMQPWLKETILNINS
jgi:8-oxo-dGTP diphosphatase